MLWLQTIDLCYRKDWNNTYDWTKMIACVGQSIISTVGVGGRKSLDLIQVVKSHKPPSGNALCPGIELLTIVGTVCKRGNLPKFEQQIKLWGNVRVKDVYDLPANGWAWDYVSEKR